MSLIKVFNLYTHVFRHKQQPPYSFLLFARLFPLFKNFRFYDKLSPHSYRNQILTHITKTADIDANRKSLNTKTNTYIII